MQQPLNLSDAIYNLQSYLRAISFEDDRITRPPLDGLFDTDTQRAVTDFQRTRTLSPTGVVDKETHDAIFNEYLILKAKNDRPPTPNFFPANPKNYEAALGDEDAFIALVQIILRELSAVYDGFEEIEVTGKFDAATEKAIKSFQQISRLDATGKIDLATYNRLTRDFFNYSPF